MTNYRKGRRLEYKCKKHLESLGYVCTRSAGSRGPVDIIAFGVNDVLAIQVKKKGAADPDAVDYLRTVPKCDCVTRQVWEYDRGHWLVYWSD